MVFISSPKASSCVTVLDSSAAKSKFDFPAVIDRFVDFNDLSSIRLNHTPISNVYSLGLKRQRGRGADSKEENFSQGLAITVKPGRCLDIRFY